MTLGSQLDQQNKEFFTTQDIRQTQATGAETRATIGAQGEQDRATQAQLLAGQLQQIGATGEQQRLTTVTAGEQQRLGTVTAGEQQRLGTVTAGEQQRLSTVTEGEQQRLGIAETGEQQRKTDLQQIMQRNYEAARNRDWSRAAYRV